MPEVEEAFEEIDVDAPLVGIIMGSKNDKPKMQPAGEALQDAGIRYEVRVMSAHRDPETVREYCTNARMRGLKVIIAGAGMSAALPGVAAAHTDLPVIGVPILGKNLGGLDALLSAVQMPPGVPVACVAIDGAKNAGVLAARIINARRLVDRRDPRYTRPEIGRRLDRRSASMETLARGRAGRDRRLGRGGRGARRRRREACRERAAFTVEAVEERERTTDHDVAAFVDVVAALGRRATGAGSTTGSPPPTCSTRRSRCSCARPARSSLAGARAYRDALVERALRAPRHALRRPHPRRPRRADHLRPAARRLRLRGRPQPRSGSSGAFEQARRRQALRRGRHLRLGAARGRGAG